MEFTVNEAVGMACRLEAYQVGRVGLADQERDDLVVALWMGEVRQVLLTS